MVLNWSEYIDVARQAVAEGAVLLSNQHGALPFEAGCRLAVFGRMQNYYYKSGTGSGGMVNVSKVWGILDALLASPEISVNQKLVECYRQYDSEHPYDTGVGFGNEPWSQEEMPVDAELVREVSKETDAALVILARTAGEEKDNQDLPGAYRLTETEEDLLRQVRAQFQRMVVVLNVGAILDMSALEEIAPDAVMYVWQGGMVGGLGIADLLLGKVSPSGKLSDTIAKSISDYPAYKNFGSTVQNFYQEDIYVGYRYFETFAPEKVLYPFGYGLSYTDFSVNAETVALETGADGFPKGSISVRIKNIGEASGKEVVQLYVGKPQGDLGKPAKELIAYAKTSLLAPGEETVCVLAIEPYALTSYDDSGVTGYSHTYVLEAGTYTFYVGTSVRDAKESASLEVSCTQVYEAHTQAMAPMQTFSRMKPVWNGTGYEVEYEAVPLAKETDVAHRLQNLPKEIPYTGDKGIVLADVRDGKATMEAFVAQLSDEDLSCIVRGEGMGSPKVTPGTAAAFGGVSPRLKAFGIPCGCCSDGPSGMRLDCGTKAFSLPSGTLLACTFNDDLNTELYHLLGLEMTANQVDVLLGPGMNIHRHPLNGRNFEYFSEDPLLTGKMAAAQIRGLRSAGVTGTLKHFCGNNQEINRHGADAIVSERGLREIYLKGFEIAVKEANANSVMTTYGPVNGIWTNSRYELNTTILREEWGFEGVVMTDWWSNIGVVGEHVSKNDFASIVRAQNDFYAVCPDGAVNTVGDNTLEALQEGTLTRGELQRSAANICGFLMNTNAMKRLVGEPVEISVINKEEEEEPLDVSQVVYYPVEDETVVTLDHVSTERGSSFVFAFDVKRTGDYLFEITGKSDLSESAQIPVTCFFQGILGAVFTWNGTAGEWVTMSKKLRLGSRYSVARLYFGGGGIQLRDVRLTYLGEADWNAELSDYMIG